MTEKITIFGVDIDCITAKAAMLRALEFMENDFLDTIEIVSMQMLLEGKENSRWKEDVSEFGLNIPGEKEILEASGVEDKGLLKEAQGRVFLKMFMRYLQRNNGKVYLLAGSDAELANVAESVERYDRGIRIVGAAVMSPEEESPERIVNEINGTETDCIISVLPSPYQEEFIREYRPLLNAKVWLGCGTALGKSYGERQFWNRIREFFTKKLFRYQVGHEQE